MADVEANRSGRPMNPYSRDGPEEQLSPWHPMNLLNRCLYMGIAIYGLDYFNAYEVITKSPKVRHEWFKIGLACTIALLFIKAYVELYAGKIQKKKVEYKSFKQSTHAVMILLMLSSVAFHVAIWPAYGSTALLVMFLVGMLLFNFCILMPTTVQNLVAFVLLTFFLQQYK